MVPSQNLTTLTTLISFRHSNCLMWPHSLLPEILLDLITFQDARGRGVASDWPLVHPQSSVSLKVETARFMNMAELIFVGTGGPRIISW